MFDKVSLEEITDEFAKAAGEDLSFVAGADLLDVVRQTERLRRFLDAVESHALARIDVTNVCELEFGMTAGSWLAHECLLPAGVAKKRVRVATKLATVLPRTNQALTKGEIGFDHAAAMAAAANPRIAEAVGEIEAELLAPIPLATFERWKQELAGIVQLLDEDGGHDPERDVRKNRLHLSRDINGVLQFRGGLLGEHGACFEARLSAAADELFRRFSRDHKACPELEIPSRLTLLALALVELCRHGTATHHQCNNQTMTTTMITTITPTTMMVTSGADAMEQCWRRHRRWISRWC